MSESQSNLMSLEVYCSIVRRNPNAYTVVWLFALILGNVTHYSAQTVTLKVKVKVLVELCL